MRLYAPPKVNGMATQHFTSPEQQGYHPPRHSAAYCDRCSTIDAFETILEAYQRRIDDKRAELQAVYIPGTLVEHGYTRTAIIQLLRAASPHVITHGALQEALWGECGEDHKRNLRVQVSIIRTTPGVLEPGESIVTVKGIGYRLLNVPVASLSARPDPE